MRYTQMSSRIKRLVAVFTGGEKASWWQDIREAIAGTERDFTESSVGKAIFILSVPMVLEMVMESLFSIADIWFVSRLGADAIATVGLTESVMTIVYSVASGFGVATTALVARRIGEKDPRGAGSAAVQAILLALLVSVVISLPGIFLAREFLILMGTTEAVAEEYALYPAIIFGSNGVVMLLFIINAIFRSSGDAAISFRVILVANLINLVLDPLFIFGWGPVPALGIKGAAIATAMGRGIAVIYQLYLLLGGHHRIAVKPSDFRVRPRVMGELVRVSLGGIFQNLIATSSWIFLVRIIAVFGSLAVAGYTIAIRIIVFALLPASGIANAAATLVGQNLGAGHPQRAERSVWITSYVNMAMMGLIGLLLVLLPGGLISFFSSDQGVISQGTLALRIISMGFVFYGLSMVMIQAFNGSGDTVTPTIIFFFGFWLVEIPLAWLFAFTLQWGLTGTCLAIVIAESLVAVVAWWYFRKGKWKTEKI